MSDLIERYLQGLKAAYEEAAKSEYGQASAHFFRAKEMQGDLKPATGATDEDIARLLAVYPDCPAALVELPKQIDGTYWREYGVIAPNFAAYLENLIESDYDFISG
jgi:hypothetical protein